MERVALEVVPGGAVASREPAERYVFTALPDAAVTARTAVALVELLELNRERAAAAAPLDPEALAAALTAGRKALRRARRPLPSDGRCERAERWLSDRLDGALAATDATLLAVHLDRCPRCVEHDRVLEQARSALRAGFAASRTVAPAPVETSPSPKLVAVPAPRPPALPATPPALRRDRRSTVSWLEAGSPEVRAVVAMVVVLLLMAAALAAGVAIST